MIKRLSLLHACSVALAGITLAAGAASAETVALTLKSLGDGVPNAQPRVDHRPTLTAPNFSLRLVAQGTDALENPSGVITNFGFLNDTSIQPVEATKTEPDENTYLVLDQNPGGPQADFDYGRHFLYQGHENGNDLAYITRINLDVNDPDRRITLLTPVGPDGKTQLNRIDGSTYNPRSSTLLFTQENGPDGGVIEMQLGFNRMRDAAAGLRTLYGVMGRGGYEGIHPDDRGNIFIVEDVGGTGVNVKPSDPASPKAARNPNSFVYRFVPKDPTNLSHGGKLQALQVSIGGAPVVYVPVDESHLTGDVFSANQLKLHTPGTSYPVKWVTVHDTTTDGIVEFDANAAAKIAGATPFKRPENMQFKPGSGFQTFFFDTTGDTSVDSGNRPALAARGAWGSIFRVNLDSTRDTGSISIFVLGTRTHNSFDNLTFTTNRLLLAGEDRGDTLHEQLNALDSIWAFDTQLTNPPGVRLLALGRDKLAEADAAFGEAGTPGFQNDGDNETTGLHFSNGGGLPGMPLPESGGVLFFTQQHGENNLYQIVGGTSGQSCDLFF